jgi:hypothetical protein
MDKEAIEAKKRRIVAAANSIGFVVRNISEEAKKTIITFKKDGEKHREGLGCPNACLEDERR